MDSGYPTNYNMLNLLMLWTHFCTHF